MTFDIVLIAMMQAVRKTNYKLQSYKSCILLFVHGKFVLKFVFFVLKRIYTSFNVEELFGRTMTENGLFVKYTQIF